MVNELISKITGQKPDQSTSVGVIAGILWQRSGEIRRHAYGSYNPFRTRGYTDPSLLRDLVSFGKITEIDISEDDWRDKYQQSLRDSGFVTLVSHTTTTRELHALLIKLIAQPVDDNYLQFYPAVYKYERRDDVEAVTLVLRDRV